MKKIFVNEKPNNYVVLTGDKHNHLSFSLRSRIGDKVTLCYENIDYLCEIATITKSSTELKVLSVVPCDTEPDLDVTLFFAIMKGDKNENVAQKCVELGVKHLLPFVSANCECRVESVKIERINRIVTEAAEQCGRGVLPLIDGVLDFDTVVDSLKNYDLVVFPYERETDTPIKTVLKDLAGKKIAIIVGSEGGFTEREAEILVKNGAASVSLGKRILRAETASVAVVSAVMYEGDQWKIN